jgi:hypothetical protein
MENQQITSDDFQWPKKEGTRRCTQHPIYASEKIFY